MTWRSRYGNRGGFGRNAAGQAAAHPSHVPYQGRSAFSSRLVQRSGPSAVEAPESLTRAPFTLPAIFTANPRVMELLEVQGEALHALQLEQNGQAVDSAPYDALPDLHRAQLRQHAALALLMLCPWVHAAALSTASRRSPNFDDGLEAYLDALLRQAAMRPVRPAERPEV